MNKRILSVIAIAMIALALASCARKGTVSTHASALAHPTSTMAQQDEQLAKAAIKACFPQTVTGEAHLLSRKAAGDGHTAGYDARQKVYACMQVPQQNRARLDAQVQGDLFQVHSRASLEYELGSVLPAQVAAARA